MGSGENDIVLIVKATNFAALKHSTQRRKDPEATPYINHPIGVAQILIEEGGISDPATIAAALLHDTVEDTDTTFEEITEKFGEEICSIVKEVTDDKTLPKEERKRLQVETAPHKSPKAKQVKLADKLYNLRDLNRVKPESWTDREAQEYFKWGESVVNGLRGANPQLEKQLDLLFKEKSTTK